MAWRRGILRAIVRLFPPADNGVSGKGPELLQYPRKPTNLTAILAEGFREYWNGLKRDPGG